MAPNPGVGWYRPLGGVTDLEETTVPMSEFLLRVIELNNTSELNECRRGKHEQHMSAMSLSN